LGLLSSGGSAWSYEKRRGLRKEGLRDLIRIKEVVGIKKKLTLEKWNRRNASGVLREGAGPDP